MRKGWLMKSKRKRGRKFPEFGKWEWTHFFKNWRSPAWLEHEEGQGERDSHLWKARCTLWKSMTVSWGSVKRVPGFTLENCILASPCLPGSHQCSLFRSLILTYLVGHGSPNFIPSLTCCSMTLWLSSDKRMQNGLWRLLGDSFGRHWNVATCLLISSPSCFQELRGGLGPYRCWPHAVVRYFGRPRADCT